MIKILLTPDFISGLLTHVQDASESHEQIDFNVHVEVDGMPGTVQACIQQHDPGAAYVVLVNPAVRLRLCTLIGDQIPSS